MATVPVQITWVVGQVVTAAQLNANVRDAVNFLLAPPFAVMRQTVAQSIATTTFVTVLLDAEDIDRDNGHSTVTNTSRYTAQTAGWYSGDSTSLFGGNTTGRRLSHWLVNGSTVGGDAGVPTVTSGGGGTGLSYSRRMYLNVGDYAEIQVFQDSGGALSLQSGSYMSLLWISS